MIRARFAPLPFALAAALTGCTPARPPLLVEAAMAAGGCEVIVEGRSLTPERIRTSDRLWRGRPVSLHFAPQLPYKCVGGTVFALQRAGAGRISLVSEAPRK